MLAKISESPEIKLTEETDPVPDSRLYPAALMHQDKSVMGSFYGMIPWVLQGEKEFNAELFLGIHLIGQRLIGLGQPVQCAAVTKTNVYLAVAIRTIVGRQGRQTALLLCVHANHSSVLDDCTHAFEPERASNSNLSPVHIVLMCVRAVCAQQRRRQRVN